MRGFLLDTDVISATSPLRANDPDLSLQRWLVARSDRLFLPVVTLGEIRSGVEQARRKGQVAKAERLETWLLFLTTFYAARILPLDLAAADLAGRLFDRARLSGGMPGWIDAQVAAIAQANGLMLLTRNVRHYAAMGVDFRDPFAEGPDRLDAFLKE